MSRKNNRAKYQRMVQHYQHDEKERLAKNKKKNDARLKNKGVYVEPEKKSTKKAKVAPVVANPKLKMDKETRKMEKMLKKMKVTDKNRIDKK